MKLIIAFLMVGAAHAANAPLSLLVNSLENRYECKIDYPEKLKYRSSNLKDFSSLEKSLSKLFHSESYTVTVKDSVKTVNVIEKSQFRLGDLGKTKVSPMTVKVGSKELKVEKNSMLLSFKKSMSLADKERFLNKNDLKFDRKSLQNNLILVRSDKDVSTDLIATISKDDNVTADFNHMVKTAGTDSIVVNLAQVDVAQIDITDEFYSQQWGHQQVKGQTGYLDQKNKLIKVVVLDTGVNLSHEDLEDSNVANRDFNDTLLTDNDVNGHGTGVIGIIGAAWNGKGISGLSGAEVISVKVFDN
ncbi:MAG: S8 family serine peptidase [Candidatus Cloacimonetes bacterium]|nr:S8 family serine peptidase [Candidatus Cloacimonadota bacterium]